MILAAWRDALIAAPASFVAGLIVGAWIGGRFTISKHRDT